MAPEPIQVQYNGIQTVRNSTNNLKSHSFLLLHLHGYRMIVPKKSCGCIQNEATIIEAVCCYEYNQGFVG
jgi:hypothetical protein